MLSRADAQRRGFSRHAIDHRLGVGTWRRILPSTYHTADVLTGLDRLRAGLSYAGDGATLSGAAALWCAGVRRVDIPPSVLVLVPITNRARSYDWVRVRSTSRPIVAALAPGPRHVEVARATADHALALRRLDDVRAIVARVVQAGLCTVDQLGAELAAGPRNGSAHLRAALTEIGWGAASAPEARAARILRRAGLIGFDANATIALPGGRTRVVDFYWPRLRACLEIDSVEYHFERADWLGTWDRHLDLTALGFSVIHRPPSALRDERRFVSDVRAWLAGREADLRRGLGA